ncbi:MAG: HAMP domain-containing sensor histidine kinase [Clostridia bacterium]|nr:HAMP domain-containing sensor histidine kinase [Clostridia bacterium]
MNKKEHKHTLALILLAATIVFFIILVAVVLSAATVYLLLDTGVITTINGRPDPRHTLMFMGIISLLIGSVLTAVISKFSLQPVNRIVTQMNRLASGDFKARLKIGKPLGTYKTIIEVTESFNKMAEELENTEMLRSDFINNFSHEFKTPIVSIAGFAKLLKRGNLTEEQKREYIDIIEEESMRLAAMATNVLNLTKYENQMILTDVTTFNLSEQLRSSILALEGKWSKKNIDFNLDFSEHMIEGNKDMLKHMWINLIDNAVKFSSDGKTVGIGIKEQNGYYEVSVQNHGSEIAPEQQKKIFNKFYQADESHASEGNGVGLALVKGISELHGGRVSVYCENNITTFTVTLPKKQ